MVSNKRFCGQCGVEVPVDDRFCGSCGHKLGQQAASSSSEPAPTSDHDSNYKTNYKKNFMQEWESKIQKDSTSSPSEPIPTSATETPTNDSRSPVQRFLEQGQETAEASTTEPSEQIIQKITCPHCDGTGTEKQGDRLIKWCEFCVGGFIEKQVALSPAGRVGRTASKSSTHSTQTSVKGNDQTGIVEPNKADSKDRWFLAAVLWIAILGLEILFLYSTLRCTPERMNQWDYCEPSGEIEVILSGLVAFVLWFLVGYFCTPSFFDPKNDRAKERRAKHLKKKDAEKARQKTREKMRQGYWKNNLQLVCPHCTVKGSVEQYVPPSPPDDFEELSYQLGKDTRRALLSLVLKDPAETTTAEDIKTMRDNAQKPKPPNMKCMNCNTQWSV